jgi:hypothetical protein
MCQLGNVEKVVKIDKKDALVAYRAWGFNLSSLYQPHSRTKWEEGKIVRSHAAPTKKNAAGLYGFKTQDSRNLQYGTKAIRGIIKVWGTVAIHEFGYRATRAEIVKITAGKKHLPELAEVS